MSECSHRTIKGKKRKQKLQSVIQKEKRKLKDYRKNDRVQYILNERIYPEHPTKKCLICHSLTVTTRDESCDKCYEELEKEEEEYYRWYRYMNNHQYVKYNVIDFTLDKPSIITMTIIESSEFECLCMMCRHPHMNYIYDTNYVCNGSQCEEMTIAFIRLKEIKRAHLRFWLITVKKNLSLWRDSLYAPPNGPFYLRVKALFSRRLQSEDLLVKDRV